MNTRLYLQPRGDLTIDKCTLTIENADRTKYLEVYVVFSLKIALVLLKVKGRVPITETLSMSDYKTLSYLCYLWRQHCLIAIKKLAISSDKRN